MITLSKPYYCGGRPLTYRLGRIVDSVPACETFADVGCDHGYIGISVLADKRAAKVVFCDISAPSLAKARANCPQELLENATFVCRDGLPDVFVDCACIAGMGGLETIGILIRAKYLPSKLVLQPMRNQVDVRRWLTNNGYAILHDVMFADADKYYDLIVAERCAEQQTLDELQLCFGKDNLVEKGEDFVCFLHKKKHTYEEILNNCADEKVVEQLRLVNSALQYITEELA